MTEGSPSWSPDGRLIAFHRGGPRKHIVVADADTGRARWIIRRRYGVSDPSWRTATTLVRAKRPACR